MTTQLHLAYGIVEGRAHHAVDQAMMRDVARARRSARADARRARRALRTSGR